MPNIDSWSTDQVAATSRLARRSTPVQSPQHSTREPLAAAAHINQTDFLINPAYEHERVRCDKWLPILCEIHH